MAKRKFNKEERGAIIQKLEKIAKEREQQSWEDCRKAYKPSETYIKAEALLTVRNEACKALKELDFYFFSNWNTFTPRVWIFNFIYKMNVILTINRLIIR